MISKELEDLIIIKIIVSPNNENIFKLVGKELETEIQVDKSLGDAYVLCITEDGKLIPLTVEMLN